MKRTKKHFLHQYTGVKGLLQNLKKGEQQPFSIV